MLTFTRGIRLVVGEQRARDAESTVATAAAQALRKDAVGIVTERRDVARAVDGHRACVAAAIAETADARTARSWFC